MISKYSHKSLSWIDIEAPQEDEISHIVDLYSIPDYVKDEIILTSSEDRIRIDFGYIFASLEIPSALSSNIKNKIILVVSDNFVLTIHNEKIHGLNKFSKELELDIIVEEKIVNNKLLFAHLLKNIYMGSYQQIADNSIKIKNLKNQIIQKNKKIKKLTAFIILLTSLLIIFIWL